MENLRFTDGKCYIGESYALEAPLEAFGQVKLVNAFNAISSVSTVREIANLLGLLYEVPIESGPRAGQPQVLPFEEIKFTVMSVLQRAWFEMIPGGVPKHVQENYDERLSHYQAAVDKIKRGETMSEPKAKGVFGQPGPRKVYEYKLNPEKPLTERHVKIAGDAATTNHVGIILAILIAQAGVATALDKLIPACEATGRYNRKEGAKETMRQNVVYILNKLEEDGYVIANDITPAAAPAPVTASAEPAPAAANAETTKAPEVVKKANAETTKAPEVVKKANGGVKAAKK